MRKLLIFTFILLQSLILFAQNDYYTNPLKIPMYLSGSFAELRSNHFHSGIDIKTQGVQGKTVVAAADGYVSRIAISPTGFGNALYINHPNGTTTVYAHLKSFTDEINKYVKEEQYNNKSFRVDLYPSSTKFVFKKGDKIGLSGNSGSSGGPHLHFEIRDGATQEPMNPLNYNLDITDNIAPKIFSLLVVPIIDHSLVNDSNSKKRYPVVFYDGAYHVKNNPTITAIGDIGFAINSYDYMNDTHNRCGLYTAKLLVDDVQQFSYELERFSFSNTRYINSHIDYDTYKTYRSRYQKLWRDPGNHLPIYKHNNNYGAFNFDDNRVHDIEIVITDTYGNTSKLKFKVKGSPESQSFTADAYTKILRYHTTNNFSTENLQFEMPKFALYENVNFVYQVKNKKDDLYSSIHELHKETTPIHKRSTLSIKVEDLPTELFHKAIIVKLDNKTGKKRSAGGDYNNGWVTTKIRDFGNYAVAVDTIAPRIIPLSIKNKAAITETNRLRFKISDDLSGIKSFVGEMDGKWMLFEYDAKRKLITHYFDSEKFELKKRHNFTLKVTDNKNNIATYEATFWK